MTQDEDVCRFCLDSRNTLHDPLITPCQCKGSIQYIHSLCLRHWRLMNPARNGFTCLLCFTPYILHNDDILEIIPEDGTIFVFFLRYPFALFSLVNYFAVMHYTLIPTKIQQSYTLFEIYQYLFQILFFMLFIGNWTVKNKRAYIKFFVTKGLLTSIVVQILSNVYIHQHDFITGLTSLNLTMGYYWQKHRESLEMINKR